MTMKYSSFSSNYYDESLEVRVIPRFSGYHSVKHMVFTISNPVLEFMDFFLRNIYFF